MCVIVYLLSRVRLIVIPRTAAPPASLFFTVSQSLLKLMSIEVVMLSNHLILCCPLSSHKHFWTNVWIEGPALPDGSSLPDPGSLVHHHYIKNGLCQAVKWLWEREFKGVQKRASGPNQLVIVGAVGLTYKGQNRLLLRSHLLWEMLSEILVLPQPSSLLFGFVFITLIEILQFILYPSTYCLIPSIM